jgi:TolB-like protein
MYLAWVYEMTPEGIRADDGETRPTGGGRLNAVIVAGTVLAAGWFLLDKYVLEPDVPAAPVPEKSVAAQTPMPDEEATADAPGMNTIAVLPFVNMSSDPEQEYFSDGLSEELLNLLARIPELQVTSRSSAFAYKGKEINLPEVASTLGVAHILEGSVRKSGNRIRVTAQLIDAGRDVNLWSDTYDHTLDDVFSIQDQISTAVVEALKITLLGEAPTARQIDPEAMDLNLQANYFWHRRGEGDVERARKLYEHSVEIDSGNAPAWTGLSAIYSEMTRHGSLSREEGRAMAKNAAVNAVEADPDFPEGHIRLAWILNQEGDAESAREHRQFAARLEPKNQLVVFDRAIRLNGKGRMDQAIELFEYLAEIDPLSAINQGNLGAFYIALGRLGEAEAALKKTIELSPESDAARHSLVTLRLFQGRFEEALELAETLEPGNDRQTALSIIHHEFGNPEASQKAFDSLVPQDVRPPEAWKLKIHAWKGELDIAFELLQGALNLGIGISPFVHDPYLKNMHADPRWELLLRQAGWDPQATLDE